MILPDFILHSRVNARWDYSGIDSIKDCLDKTHFKNYPHKVEYSYNSRGFRDAEWPDSVEELKNAIWCIGDSFTVGVGSPLKHTWPYLLQQQTGRRCINVSMDGASNEWIARKTQKIIKEINPTDIVIMWSYTHRREKKDNSLSDEDRRTHVETVDALENAVNFKSCLDSVVTVDDFTNLSLNIVTELIDDFKVYNRMLELSEMARIIDYCKSVHDLLEVKQLDYARDYHHFDKLTSQWLIEQIC